MDLNTQPAAAPVATAQPSTSAEPDVFALAAAADAGQDLTETSPSVSAPDSKPDTASESAESAKPAEDAQAQPTAEPTLEQKPKQETAYQRAKAAGERLDRSWKKLEEEKAQFRKERSQWEEERRKTSAPQATPAQPEPTLIDGHPAEVWERLAKRKEAEGDHDLAEEARQRAQKAREADAQKKAAPSVAVQQSEPWKSPEFQAEWTRNTQELIQAEPELNDPGHPVFKSTNMLVNDPKWSRFFRSHPDGIKAAVQVAKLIQQSEQAAKATAEIKTLKAEIDRLNKLTQPRGSLPPGSAPAKRPEDITDVELMALATASDRG